MTTTTQPLPQGWETEILKKLCTIKTGDKDVNQGNENGEYPFFTCARDISNADTYSFDGQAVLIAGNGNFNVKKYDGKFEAYQRTYVLQGFKNIDFNYLYYFIEYRLQDITKGNRGSTIRYIRLGDIADYQIIYPKDLSTQTAIVAKIDRLFAEIDTGIASLKSVQNSLIRYRQSLLKNAFNGKLTEQWRAEQNNLPTADELLTQIQQSRQTHYENQLTAYQTALKDWEQTGKVGKKPSKPEKIVFYGNIAKKNNQNYLPINEIALSINLGKMLDKNKNTGEFREYLGNINVRWDSFNLSDLKEIKIENHELDRYSLKKFDLVVCEGGEPARCAVWDFDKEMIIQKALHRIRFDVNVFSPYFVQKYFEFLVISGEISQYLTGTTIKHLTVTNLEKILLPLNSIQEQTQIVQILDRQFAQIEQLTAIVADSLKKAEWLKSAILKKAFCGELINIGEINNDN